MESNGKISPFRAPIHILIVTWYEKNPVKRSFSFPVENTLYYRSVCQNKVDLNLTQCPPMALQSVLFLPRTITHLNPRNPARMRIWGSIFSDEGKWGIRQLAFCPSKGYEMLVGFPFSIIGIRKRIWTIFYFRFSRAYNSRYEKKGYFLNTQIEWNKPYTGSDFLYYSYAQSKKARKTGLSISCGEYARFLTYLPK